jgi:hypothetical protein
MSYNHSGADISRSTLELVPRQVAETFQVYPVMFDAASHALSVVTADPDDEEVLRQIQITSGAKEVRAFVGRPVVTIIQYKRDSRTKTNTASGM